MAIARRLAPHPPRRAAGRAQAAGRSTRAPAAGAGLRPARAHRRTPASTSRASSASRRRVRPSSSPTTAPTSTSPPMGLLFAKAGRPVRFLGKKEVFDAPVIGAAGPGHRRHPGRPGHRQRRAAAGGGRGPRGRSSWWRSCRRAPSRVGRPSSTPCCKGRWGAARLAAHDEGAGDPGRAVGHREGLAAQQPAAQRAQRDATRRRSRVRVGRARRRSSTRASTKDTERIMEAIVDLLPPEARERARADARGAGPHLSRPGYKGDPGGETKRRPGTD